MKIRTTPRGFTFIELLVSLAIVSVLATMALPLARLESQRRKETELRSALMQIREAIDAYKRASEQGRIDLQPGDSGYPPTLAALTDGVVDQRSPLRQRIYFLRRLPRDPTNPDESLTPEASWGRRSYRSPPDAPEAGSDVFDVFSTSTAVGLNGVAYRQW